MADEYEMAGEELAARGHVEAALKGDIKRVQGWMRELVSLRAALREVEAQRDDWKERAALEARRLVASGARAEAAERKVGEYRQRNEALLDVLRAYGRQDEDGEWHEWRCLASRRPSRPKRCVAACVRARDALREEQPRHEHSSGCINTYPDCEFPGPAPTTEELVAEPEREEGAR